MRNDPGVYEYLAAYERVLSGGVPELLRDNGALPGDFDITERMRLSHADASSSPRNRWFSVLTACIELLSWDGAETSNYGSASQALCHLTTDSFALHDGGDERGPLDVLPSLCRDIQRASANLHLRLVALLGELLVSDEDAAQTSSTCAELARLHDEFQVSWIECTETGEWMFNRWHARGPELVWGSCVSDKKELRMWISLVEAHFPTSSPVAVETRERLLRDGQTWKRPSHRR